MTIISKISTIERKIEHHIFEMGHGLRAINTRKEDQHFVDGKLSECAVSNTGGVIDIDVEQLKNSDASYSTLGGYAVVEQTMREKFREIGFVQTIEKCHGDLITGHEIYDALHSGVYSVDDVTRLDSSSHMIFNLDGSAAPCAIYFNYIGARISDAAYDLEKLVGHLLKRSDVVIFPHQGGWRKDKPDMKGSAKDIESAIADIPYYNADTTKTKCVYFKWMPSDDDYRKMWDWCLSNVKKYPSTGMHQAVFELDLLSLRQCGAAKFDNFWGMED